MRILTTATRRSGVIRSSAVVLGMLACLLAAATAARATPPPAARPTQNKVVRVEARADWTPTGVELRRGDLAEITATGVAHFGQGPIASLPPEGIPQGGKCTRARAVQRTRQTALPAPTLNCFSLIGRIGRGDPFEIGRSAKVTAEAPGELRLGVNDDFRIDNSGHWLVTIRTSAAPPPKPATKPAATTTGSKKSNNFLLLVAVAAGLIIALLLLAWFLRRRRDRSSHPAAPKPAAVPVPAAPAVAPTAAAGTAAATEDVVVPPEGESTAGNILEVTLSGGRSLMVGYNHFPEGTIVHFRITQNTNVITGQFETDGRSAAQQDVTVPLDSELDVASPADVAFAWSVGGVAFNYSVRRNPDPEPQT
jgi:hypothetical protein